MKHFKLLMGLLAIVFLMSATPAPADTSGFGGPGITIVDQTQIIPLAVSTYEECVYCTVEWYAWCNPGPYFVYGNDGFATVPEAYAFIAEWCSFPYLISFEWCIRANGQVIGYGCWPYENTDRINR